MHRPSCSLLIVLAATVIGAGASVADERAEARLDAATAPIERAAIPFGPAPQRVEDRPGATAIAPAVLLPGALIEQADRVLVVKSERKLYLLEGERRLREFDVSLGLAPTGHKARSGDSRTPEGVYYLDDRNTDSDFFLSIHVSYPNDADRRHAAALGVDPGGQIMIHGLPNELKYDEGRYLGTDWTDGCIGLANADMIDVWLMTSPMTPIEIRP